MANSSNWLENVSGVVLMTAPARQASTSDVGTANGMRPTRVATASTPSPTRAQFTRGSRAARRRRVRVTAW
ncbi:hypothetical protein D3C81_2191160 [compost metagenome]